jgi:hypothetical protein
MIESPGKIEATLKIRMQVSEWEELRDQLTQRWPSSRLSEAITNLLSQARKVFYEEHQAS